MALVEFKILGYLPSVNSLINREKIYSDTKKKLEEILKENYGDYEPINFPVRIVIYHYLRKDSYTREDIDNKQKIIQDAMNGIILEDDSLIFSMYSEKRIAKCQEYFTVLVEEFDETKNDNSGEIIGSIDDHTDKELRAREVEVSIKSKKILELENEIEEIKDKRDDYKKELQDKISELTNLKKKLEEKNRDLSNKNSAIDNHMRDKALLKEENKILIGKLKYIEDKVMNKKIENNLEEEFYENNVNKDKIDNMSKEDIEELNKLFLIENEEVEYSELGYNLEKFISSKASEMFLVEIVNDFEKNQKISKKKIKNKISCDKVKKMIKELFKVNLMIDGDYLIINNREKGVG